MQHITTSVTIMNEIDKYYTHLLDAYDNNQVLYCDNTDRLHNAAIMRLMLEKGDGIMMYCGEMSIFRNVFYEEIAKTSPLEAGKWKQIIKDALIRYLSIGKILDVVVENYSDMLLNDCILSKEEISDFPIRIYQLPESIGNKRDIQHFSFTSDEKIVRLETAKKDHSAICKIGIDSSGISPKANFNKLKDLAQAV